ncbi:MAG: glycine cleavage T C-terminal barrel domain-containing protein, partial [Candidatus Nanopelagicales bacterium]
GSYAHRAILYDPEDLPSIEEAPLSPTEFAFTPEDFELQLEHALELMPEIVGDESVGQRYAINGILSLTADGLPVLGETPEVAGLWSVAAVWIKEGPGIGRAVAETMVLGESEIDISASDVARFHDHERTNAHVKARTGEGFIKTYGIVHPAEQWSSDRDLRLPPFFDAQKALGAHFHETVGWERPWWYESNADLLEEYGDKVMPRTAEWESRWWSPIINAEHLAMRDRAGIIDLTAFTIFDLEGPGALDTVQNLALRQMDVALGKVVYTPILAPGGGYKSDLTIMRVGPEHFRVVTGGAHGMADKKWFSNHTPADGSVKVTDLTSEQTTLGLWGPRARDILSSLTSTDVSHDAFKFGTFQELELAGLPVMASRISYVGELGWEIYAPMSIGSKLWDAVWEAGRSHGAVPVGIGVYGTTGRLEKSYRAYGTELETDFNVVEAGMTTARVKEADFIGKASHLAQREQEPAALMSTLVVQDHTSSTGEKRYMLGKEPILSKSGEPLVDAKGRRSYVTSAGSAPSLGSHLLMSYLPPAQAIVGTELLVEYLGEQYPVQVASVGTTALFDPKNERSMS